jgi:uncharacterized protein YkwD
LNEDAKASLSSVACEEAMTRCLILPVSAILVLLATLPSAAVESKKDKADKKDKKTEPKFKLSADEQTLLKLLNAARAKEKLPALKVSPLLTKIARAHSANMAKQGKMAHVLDGKGPAERAKDAGYDYRKIGENVAFSDDGDEGPTPLSEIQEMWMKSKAHRKNILEPKYREVGLAVVRTRKGKAYYTQLFGVLRGSE